MKRPLENSPNTAAAECSVNFFHAQPSELPAKQTLIFVHGFRGTHQGLAQLYTPLTDEFEIFVPDLPGFGDTPAFTDRPHSLAEYVSFLSGFIESLELSAPPVIVGHSFGSIIAAAFAAENPAALARLILINPIGAPALKGPRKIATNVARGWYLAATKLPPKLAHAWLAWRAVTDITSWLMIKTKDPKTRRFIYDQHRRYFSNFSSAQVISEAFDASVQNDVSQFAGKITVPTLIIAGEKDDITSLMQIQTGLVPKFRSSVQLKVIPKVGHLIHYETPAPAVAAMREFLN